MTDDVNRFTFLLKQKPICTQSPIKAYLGAEKHRELRAKYKLELGIDLLDDRCGNVFNCKSLNSGCIGRPFPIDPEIYEALQTLNVTITTGKYKDRDVYLAYAIVECDKCPFKDTCETSCATQDSYLRRSSRPDSNPPESSLVSYDDFEKGIYKALEPDYNQHCAYGDWIDEELPLDCLTSRQREVIDMVIFQNLEYSVVADKLGIGIPRVSTHVKRAKARLEEFGKARKALSNAKLIPRSVLDYYVNNLTQEEIAVKCGLSQSTLSENLKKWYNDNCT